MAVSQGASKSVSGNVFCKIAIKFSQSSRQNKSREMEIRKLNLRIGSRQNYMYAVTPIEELNRTIAISPFSFQSDDVTGLSLSLRWGNNVHTMQSLRAKRLEEGALFELFQAERGARGGWWNLEAQRREGFYEFEDRQPPNTGISLYSLSC